MSLSDAVLVACMFGFPGELQVSELQDVHVQRAPIAAIHTCGFTNCQGLYSKTSQYRTNWVSFI